MDLTPGTVGEYTPPVNSDPFNASLVPVVEGDFGLFNWTDVPSSLDFSEALHDIAGPSLETSTLPVPLGGEPPPLPPTGSFCTDGCNCPTSGNSDGDTTPCTIAYEMVRRYNRKGLDMVEICVRLWNGFRVDKEGSNGCTVNSRVLFRLLDYISG
jgi:hypothetical protein